MSSAADLLVHTHPAAELDLTGGPCSTSIGPTLRPCPEVAEVIVNDWTQPGTPRIRVGARCAAEFLAELDAAHEPCPWQFPLQGRLL